MHCKSFSHFFIKKYWHIWVINVWNFNVSLTNEVVSFEQLGPGKVVHLHRTASHFYTLVKVRQYFLPRPRLLCLPLGAPVVQWVKRWPANLAVPRSSPAWGRIFSTINRVPLHTAFHYHLPIVLIWLKYCLKGRKIASHPSIYCSFLLPLERSKIKVCGVLAIPSAVGWNHKCFNPCLTGNPSKCHRQTLQTQIRCHTIATWFGIWSGFIHIMLKEFSI